MRKLAVIITHPVQYYAPLFQLLHKRQNISIKVFYTWGEGALKKFDPGFGKEIDWDIPLLEGYPYEWVKNTAADPGSHLKKGIVNPDLIAQISNWQPEAVLVFGWAYNSHLKTLRYFKNKLPVYFRGDSTLLNDNSGIRAILKTIYLKWVYSNIDHAFYVGANNKAYFKKYGLKEDQLTFAPHAVDNERFSADRAAEAIALRQKLGISVTDKVILFAGKLEAKKSPGLLLNAFLTLREPDTHLVFTGNGELEAKLKAEAASNPRIHFLDFQNQQFMPVVYQMCDIFCLPSQGPGETWGLAVNEAMACGKAIIVSDKCGCAADLIKPGCNGLIFKNGSVTELANALNTLLASADTLQEYGKNSRLLITGWNFTATATAIEQQLNSLTGIKHK